MKWLPVAVVAAAVLLGLSVSVAAPAAFAPPTPVHIGVAGDFPDGLDGVLMAHGMPHERIFPWELSDLAVLKQFDVLLLSCPVTTRGQLDPALRQYVMDGGRAYLEIWAAMQGPPPFADLVLAGGNTGVEADTLLAPSDHPILTGLDPKLPINTFHLQGTFLKPLRPEAKVLAQFVPDGGGAPLTYGVAIISQPLGQGEIVYSGSPLSFTVFHRGPTTEPLLLNIISHLAGGKASPRLTTGADEPEEEATGAAPAGGMPGQGDVSSEAVPAGFGLIESAVEAPYNVTLMVNPPPRPTGEPAALLLDAQCTEDGKLKRPALWLVFTADRVSLRAGATVKSPVLASAKWTPPTQGTPLLMRRRAEAVMIALGDVELLRAKTPAAVVGAVASSQGCVRLMQAHVQPVAPPDFADDFMREPGDPSPWTAAGGQWRVVGIGNEEQSVNGFYYQSYGADPAAATAGESWWEDYAASVAVRLDGDGTAGIAALRQANGDGVMLLADSARQASPSLRLIEVRGQKETLLAQQPLGLAPGQWARLTLRVSDGKAEGLLDDAPVLQAAHQETRGGGVALVTRGGGARFDDVLVQPASAPLASPRREGTPIADLPVALGPQDALTWANLAAAWTASPERPSRLWHTGYFGNAVTYSLRLEPTPQPALRRLILAPATDAPEAQWLEFSATVQPDGKATLSVQKPGSTENKALRTVGVAEPGRMIVTREGANVALLWNKETLLKLKCDTPLTCVGLEVQGPPVAVQALRVRGPDVRDFCFGVAPVAWKPSGGTWEVASRWACDNRWSWFAGWGTGDFAVWNKRPVTGDVVMDYTVGIKMQAPGGPETTRCRDLNTVLCGDGANPRSGYSFIMGGDGGVKTQLLRKGTVVAEAPNLRVPGGYGIHHEWFHVRAARIGRAISLEFEGRPVFRYEDPDPLPGGFVGLWSRDSGVLVPRVTIYQ